MGYTGTPVVRSNPPTYFGTGAAEPRQRRMLLFVKPRRAGEDRLLPRPHRRRSWQCCARATVRRRIGRRQRAKVARSHGAWRFHSGKIARNAAERCTNYRITWLVKRKLPGSVFGRGSRRPPGSTEPDRLACRTFAHRVVT